MTEDIYIPRRNFIKAAGLGLVGSCFLPNIILSKNSLQVEKRLNLYHAHTGEAFNEVFWSEGKYVPEHIKLLNRFLRDWRTQEQTNMCPQLFELLHNITHKLDTQKPINIFSGYRSKKTNDKLRRKKQRSSRK